MTTAQDETSSLSGEDPFEGWAAVELMGHVKLGARLSEAKLAGGTFLRLDVHGETGPAEVTQLVPPPPGGPIYRITLTSERIARALGARYLATQPPVARWELPALTAAGDGPEDAEVYEDDDDLHRIGCEDDDCVGCL